MTMKVIFYAIFLYLSQVLNVFQKFIVQHIVFELCNQHEMNIA